MKISAYVGTSLDGFIARKDGDFTWLSKFATDEAITAYNEFMARIDRSALLRIGFISSSPLATGFSSAKMWKLPTQRPRFLTPCVSIAKKPSVKARF